MFRQLCAIFLLKWCMPAANDTVVVKTYSPYAFIDSAVSPKSVAPLFDALTRDIRQTGKIDMDDPITAMTMATDGETNLNRSSLQYVNKDGSKVAISFMLPQRPMFIKTPYDVTKTYVSFILGYSSEGVDTSIVSTKIIELILKMQHRCKTESIACIIRARLQETAYFK